MNKPNEITLTLKELYDAVQAGRRFQIRGKHPITVAKTGEDAYSADLVVAEVSGPGGTFLSTITEETGVAVEEAPSLHLMEFSAPERTWVSVGKYTPAQAEKALADAVAIDAEGEFRFETLDGKVVPVVGTGVTRNIGSDSYAGTIIAVSKSGHQFTMRDDNAIVISGTTQDGSAKYRYERNGEGRGRVTKVTRRANGSFAEAGASYARVNVGIRRQYQDPHF